MAERLTSTILPAQMPETSTKKCRSLSVSKYSPGRSRHHKTRRSKTSCEPGCGLIQPASTPVGKSSLRIFSQTTCWSASSSWPKPARTEPLARSTRKQKLSSGSIPILERSSEESARSTARTTRWLLPVLSSLALPSRFTLSCTESLRKMQVWRKAINRHTVFRSLRPTRSTLASNAVKTLTNVVLSIALRPCACEMPPAAT
mmetsp:Transcript_8224/g.20728  ORF Transcript_8224/g.20728 Transcript_8224/m.20728 type:complete len:202 (+) Transcript_8224:1109-1714(+)